MTSEAAFVVCLQRTTDRLEWKFLIESKKIFRSQSMDFYPGEMHRTIVRQCRRVPCIARITLILKQRKATHFQASLCTAKLLTWEGPSSWTCTTRKSKPFNPQIFCTAEERFPIQSMLSIDWEMTGSMTEAWDTSYTKEIAGKVWVLIYKEIKLSTLANILCSNWTWDKG